MKTLSNMVIAMTITILASCASSGDKKIATAHSSNKNWQKSAHVHHKPIHSNTMLLSSSGSLIGAAPSK